MAEDDVKPTRQMRRQMERQMQKRHANEVLLLARNFKHRAEMIRDFLMCYQPLCLPTEVRERGMAALVGQFIEDILKVQDTFGGSFPRAIGEKKDEEPEGEDGGAEAEEEGEVDFPPLTAEEGESAASALHLDFGFEGEDYPADEGAGSSAGADQAAGDGEGALDERDDHPQEEGR